MQTEKMTLKDFEALNLKQIGTGTVKRGYTKAFMDFMNGDDEVLKLSHESIKDARSCSGCIRNVIRKTGIKCKVINNGTNVYVIREG